MARVKIKSRSKRRASGWAQAETAVYRGKQTRTGNSLALRFERALFHSHPEFNGDVEAHIIGPGRMLVIAEPRRRRKEAEEDPALATFMSFLAADMHRLPERIKPLDAALVKRVSALVKGVSTSDDEDLGDEALL